MQDELFRHPDRFEVRPIRNVLEHIRNARRARLLKRRQISPDAIDQRLHLGLSLSQRDRVERVFLLRIVRRLGFVRFQQERRFRRDFDVPELSSGQVRLQRGSFDPYYSPCGSCSTRDASIRLSYSG